MKEDYKVHINRGFDSGGSFMDSSLRNSLNESIGNITRTYHEIVDQEFLKTMPIDTLKENIKTLQRELSRRSRDVKDNN